MTEMNEIIVTESMQETYERLIAEAYSRGYCKGFEDASKFHMDRRNNQHQERPQSYANRYDLRPQR